MKVTYLESPPIEVVRTLWGRLEADNKAKMNGEGDERIVVVAQEGASIFGGLVGYAYWGWFSVDVMWVEEECRGRGIGRSLLEEAERVAVSKGCHSAHTDTFLFQAPEFYKRMGYKEFGRLDGFREQQSRLYLKKKLKS